MEETQCAVHFFLHASSCYFSPATFKRNIVFFGHFLLKCVKSHDALVPMYSPASTQVE